MATLKNERRKGTAADRVEGEKKVDRFPLGFVAKHRQRPVSADIDR